jgi:hypothetical protein
MLIVFLITDSRKKYCMELMHVSFFHSWQTNFMHLLLHSILLYELHKSIVEREGLKHDERNEECSKGTSSTTCLVERV